MDTESLPVSLQNNTAARLCERSELWYKWEAQVQLLRLALSSKSSDSHILKLVQESKELYRASLGRSRTSGSLLAALSGRNLSSLEASFMWLGGWRPTSAITLVLSRMGIEVPSMDGQFESAAPSCCLSKTQVASLEVLLKNTRQAEGELSNELATLQMLLPDQNMAEAIGVGNHSFSPESIIDGEFLMDTKLATLRTLYAQSNRLRLQILQELLNLLTPVQAAHCIIAAFELVFALKMLSKVFTQSAALSIGQAAPSTKALNHKAQTKENGDRGKGKRSESYLSH